MSPYPSHTRPTIHDRRQSMMAGHNKLPNTPPMSDKSRDYQTQGHPSLAEEVSNSIQASQPSVGSWDPAQSQPNLPPLSEAINGISSVPSPSMAVSPPMQTQQAPLSTMNNVVASPPNFYAPAPYLDMQAPVQVYSSQDQLDADPSKMQPHGIPDRHSISGQSMVPQDSNANSGQYVRRVTYPFVHSLEPGTGLMMSNVIPSEPAGSSPLNSHSPFTHGGLVGASPVGMSRAAPAVDYMDSLGLGQAPHHHHSQASAHSQSPMHSIAWSQNGGGGGSDMSSVDGSVNGSKVYSFVPLSGVNSKKRPRRRFDEIERLYVCNWGDCEKAYGTLNHLNAHVNMQKHGPKRLPAEFKELRKAWRKHKRAEEEAAKQAAAFHQQQTQTQQAQLHQQQQQQQHHQQQSLCDPPSTADENEATSLPKNQEQTLDAQRKPAFTILKHSTSNTPTETNTELSQSENNSSHELVSGLANSLDGLQVDDETNETEDAVLDEFLVNALKSRQDRLFLLKLDREFCNFLNNPSQEHLEFPALNSYYRMVIHRVANYFKITRVVDPQQKKIMLFKTEQSAIPALRFSHLVVEEEEQPVKPVKLLLRNPNRNTNDASTPEGSSEPDRKTMSIKEREEAYAKARARIFNDEVPAKPKPESPGLTTQNDSPSASTSTSDTLRPDATEQKGRKQGSGRKSGSGSARSPDELIDTDYRQNQSSPNSRNVSRSTSPSPSAASTGSDTALRNTSKSLGPKTKHSKTDLAAECTDSRRRKSTASNASSSGAIGMPVGLARTISSSSSQDGFNSPSLGTTLTESPTVNSPSNPSLKGHDYFGQNPTSSSGSVSPMSSGSSRASFSYPQSNAKVNRNPHSGNSSGGHSTGQNNNNYSSQAPNTGFIKGMNPPTFVPKKPYPKHGNSFSGGNSFNNGPIASYPSGHGPPFHNGNLSPYTHPQLGPSNSWPDRNSLPGHDPSSFYNVTQDPAAFPYGDSSVQYVRPVQNIHPPSFNNHHNPNNHNQHTYHNPSHRGGRRNPTSKPHVGHQPHFQHPHHSRTHPQLHPTPFHHNNYNSPSTRDDFGYPQGSQPSQRFNRPFDGNPGQVPPQQFTPDIYQSHGVPGEVQSIPNAYTGFGQPLTTSPGENSV
ncbi:hypothetical protein BGZ46_010408 [Entomortierella lignicola]|nr:hypothetical protein BGZ46_010408 [Entomortierella lignicola]